MAHMVKCTVCGESFDRDKIQAVRSGARRYAHFKCKPDGEKVPLAISAAQKRKEELEPLELYVKKLFHSDVVSVKIDKQIKQFMKKNGYTASGILKTLIFFYEIRGNTTEKANGGIGIVPYVYEEAKEYYLKQYLISQVNNEKDVKAMVSQSREVYIVPPTPQRKKKRLFNIGETNE